MARIKVKIDKLSNAFTDHDEAEEAISKIHSGMVGLSESSKKHEALSHLLLSQQRDQDQSRIKIKNILNGLTYLERQTIKVQNPELLVVPWMEKTTEKGK